MVVAEDPILDAARADDPPTEVIAVVHAPPATGDATGTHDTDPGPAGAGSTPPKAAVQEAGPEPPPAPPIAAPAQGAALTPSVLVRRRPAAALPMRVIVGGLAVALVVATLVGGGIPGLIASRATPDEPVGSVQPSDQASAVPDPSADERLPQGFACSPREVTAPSSGRWRLYRTEFGPRGGHDYLRLLMRREGDHESTATGSAEVLPPSEMAARFGVEAPADVEHALVIAFNDAVGIGGQWGARPGYGALRAFQVSRGDGGNVLAVVGINGSGCFSLSAGAWDADPQAGTTELTLEIQKP